MMMFGRVTRCSGIVSILRISHAYAKQQPTSNLVKALSSAATCDIRESSDSKPNTNIIVEDWCGLPVTVQSQEVAEPVVDAFNDVMDQYLYLKGDPFKSAQEAVQLEPSCALAHCAVGIFACIGHGISRKDPLIAGSLEHAREIVAQGKGTDRDAAYTDALGYISKGQWRAGVDRLETWIATHPHDIFALRLCQDGYIFLGDYVNLRDMVSRVYHLWSTSNYGFNFLLGMQAFGYEENGDYDGAILASDRALNMNKYDAWAMHARAHVYEMMGRANEGQSFVRDKAEEWETCNLISCHLAWHLCLYYLDQGNYRAALRVYDVDMVMAKAGDTTTRPVTPFALCDYSSLLWRMELYGVDVGERWPAVAESWAKFDTLHLHIFYDFHLVLAYASMGARGGPGGEEWFAKAENFIREMEKKSIQEMTSEDGQGPYPGVNFASHNPSRWNQRENESDNAWVALKIGVPLCRAMVAYQKGEFDKVCELLLPLRYHADVVGGSKAQRDIINLTLLEAAVRLESQILARSLLSERIANKALSAQAWERYGLVLERLGDREKSEQARLTAYTLGLGQFGANSH